MKQDKPIRLLVADDHKLFRSGIISLISGERNIFVVGEAENGIELIEMYGRLLPDVALVDISMPVIAGIPAAAEIIKKYPFAKILFLSMYDDEEYIYQTYKTGGKGLLSKNAMKDELLFAIIEVYHGRNYFGKALAEESFKKILSKFDSFPEGKTNDKTEQLTEQERKVLLLISEGLSSSEIAAKLEVSKRTVDSHRANLFKKLEIVSLPELMKFAFEWSDSMSKKKSK